MTTGELKLPPHIILLDQQNGHMDVDDVEPPLAHAREEAAGGAPESGMPIYEATEAAPAVDEAPVPAADSGSNNASAADECPPSADPGPTGVAGAPDAAKGEEDDEDAGLPETNDAAQNEKPMTSAGDVSNAASDVRVYDGLTSHGLDQTQIDELFAAVHEMKSKSSASNLFKHGWQLIYTMRAPGASTRGDLCVIDPRDG